ncbi:hypothetical protein ABZX97_03350 [Streptomyces seoulensis]|uniref:hypothetical protein n=1 Tax=Streptomyces seoulensis TaxID=73044 RepID=UPI0033A92F9A
MTSVAEEEGERPTGSKWKSRMDYLNLFIALIGLGVAFVAFWVPIRMDRQARERDRSATCVDAVVDLRAALNDIEAGYVTAPKERPARMADWNAGKAEIERTQVACLHASLKPANRIEESKALWQQYDTEQSAAQDPERHSTPSLDVIPAIRTWTLAAISDLTQ